MAAITTTTRSHACTHRFGQILDNLFTKRWISFWIYSLQNLYELPKIFHVSINIVKPNFKEKRIEGLNFPSYKNYSFVLREKL